jgi:hypothetical protein
VRPGPLLIASAAVLVAGALLLVGRGRAPAGEGALSGRSESGAEPEAPGAGRTPLAPPEPGTARPERGDAGPGAVSALPAAAEPAPRAPEPTVLESEEVQRVVSGDGVVLSEVGLLGGREHGPWVARYESGRVRETGERTQLVDGRPAGVARSWSEDGELEREATFVGGVMEGALRAWSPGGAPSMELEYRAGRLHGSCRWWDESGRLLERSGRYEDGARVGPL